MSELTVKEIRELDSDATLDILISQKNHLAMLGEEISHLESNFMYRQIREVVVDNYDLGDLVEVYEIFGGYTSRAFKIVLEKNGERKDWFFRKYMKTKSESEIMFEHNLLLHARKNGFAMTAVPIATKDGKSYVARTQGKDNYSRQHYFTIYEFLPGEETYSWTNNEMPRKTYLSLAEVFAEFHTAAFDFDTQGLNGDEPPILDYVKEFPDNWLYYIGEFKKAGIKNIFTDYFASHQDYLLNILESLTINEEDLREFPLIPIQCDLHPGNLKFHDDICVGMFDFEAAKIDIRMFDVCHGLTNCFASWLPGFEGHIYLDKAEEFLRAYNNKLSGGLPPLVEAEKKYIYEVLQLSNMYMIQWCVRMFNGNKTSNPYEFFYYFHRQLGCVRWVEENKEAIRDLTRLSRQLKMEEC